MSTFYNPIKLCALELNLSVLKVIYEDKQKDCMWVYCTGTDSPIATTNCNNNQLQQQIGVTLVF